MATLPAQFIVQPWLIRDENGRLRLAPVYRPVEPPEEEGATTVVKRWGKPSPTDYVAKLNSTNSFTSKQDNGQEDNKPKKNLRLYKETSRDTVTKRVTNPEDSSQYVDVEVITSITFQGPDGEGTVKFQLNNE